MSVKLSRLFSRCSVVTALLVLGSTPPTQAQTTKPLPEPRPVPGRHYRGPEFAAKLQAFDAKYKVTNRGANDSGFVNFAEGVFSEPLNGRDPFEVALQFFEENKELFGMRDPRNELIIGEGGVPDKRTGVTHARFHQAVNGVRVWASNASAHFDRSGRLSDVESSYVPKQRIGTKARLSKEAAVRAISNAKGLPPNLIASQTELLVYGNRLVWRIILPGPGAGGEYLIGADDGEIIRYDDMRRYLAPPKDLAENILTA